MAPSVEPVFLSGSSFMGNLQNISFKVMTPDNHGIIELNCLGLNTIVAGQKGGSFLLDVAHFFLQVGGDSAVLPTPFMPVAKATQPGPARTRRLKIINSSRRPTTSPTLLWVRPRSKSMVGASELIGKKLSFNGITGSNGYHTKVLKK
ncbi:MAG: hypothetical protein GY859_21250 [Desulfobacterales bacterium]|nr:hypothetical protein [Desulfobacterales bacterium]